MVGILALQGINKRKSAGRENSHERAPGDFFRYMNPSGYD